MTQLSGHHAQRSAQEPRTSSTTAGHLVPQLLSVGELAMFLAPVRGWILVCGLLSAAGAAAGMVCFIALAELSRTVVTAASVTQVRATAWVWVIVAAGGALGRLVLLGLSSNLGHHADAVMLRHLRGRIVARLSEVPLGLVRAAGSGRVKQAMTDDLEALHLLVGHVVGQLAAGMTAVLLGTGYLLTIHVPLTLVTLSVPALAVVAYRTAMRSMPDHVNRLVAADQRIAAASVEYGDGISVIKTFGAGGRVLAAFAQAVEEYVAAFRTWVHQTRFSSAFSFVLGSEMTTLVVVAAAGVASVRAGSVPFADLLAFLLVGVALPVALMPMISAGQGLRTARMAAGSIETLLRTPPLPEPVPPHEPAGWTLELDRVSYSYDGTTPALVEVSAVCGQGTITALVGPSGAGKSTLAGLIPRFDDVTGGAIRIGGVDIRDLSSSRLLSTMTLVFQDVVLLRDSVAENIRLGRPTATDDDVKAAARAAHVHDVIAQLPNGYDTVLGSDGVSLSGGERQRLTIARALLTDAPIVILDEATAALDPDSEAAVQDAATNLIKDKTVIVIAHRLTTIARADQILVLDRGRLVEHGTHPDLLARDGLYAHLWRAQDPTQDPTPGWTRHPSVGSARGPRDECTS